MATSAKEIVVKQAVESVTTAEAAKATITTKAPILKKATKKQEKTGAQSVAAKRIAPALKTVLSPTAPWPFPTGPRP